MGSPASGLPRFFQVCLILSTAGVRIGLAEPPPAPEVVHERWESAFVGSDKIGHIHSITWHVNANGKEIFQTRQASRLTVKRFGQPMTIEMAADFFELSDGRLYATDLVQKISLQSTRSSGRLIAKGKFKITVQGEGQKNDQTIDWPDHVLGPYAMLKQLHHKPIEPGESREFTTFHPEMNIIGKRILKGQEKETTSLLEGNSSGLLRIEESMDKIDVKSTLWMDEKGDVVKSTLPIGELSMTTYLSTKEQAESSTGGAMVDLGVQTLVKPDKRVENAHSTASVHYRLEFADAASASAIPSALYQRVEKKSPTTLDVKVVHHVPEEKEGAEGKSPGDEFLGSNTYLQPGDEAIKKVAMEQTRDAKTPWEKAVRLCEWVARNMSDADFSVGLAPSSEVIRTRRGDCTEHAVLLAALCRSVSIPSRVAMGLVYLDQSQSFGYHMWTEVYVDGDWYPLDGTLGTNGIGGGHLKIADASLAGVDANSAFLPIFKVIGKLKIFVEKVNPSS